MRRFLLALSLLLAALLCGCQLFQPPARPSYVFAAPPPANEVVEDPSSLASPTSGEDAVPAEAQPDLQSGLQPGLQPGQGITSPPLPDQQLSGNDIPGNQPPPPASTPANTPDGAYYAYISGHEIAMRSGPGGSYTLLRKLSYPDIVHVLGQAGDWLIISFQDQPGYIHPTDIMPVDKSRPVTPTPYPELTWVPASVTPTPVPGATPVPTIAVYEPTGPGNDGRTYVWISPASVRYHSTNKCGEIPSVTMRQVTIEDAKDRKLLRCSRCNAPE